MAAQYLSSWNPTAIYEANATLLTLLGAASGPAKITIHSNTDALLGTVALNDPAGTINVSTGELTLSAPGNGSVSAGGTASYASLRDGNDVVYRSLPCAQGSSPVSGYCVVSSLALVLSEPLQLVSFSIV